jgi:cytoskeleton protein RodZ
MSEGQTSTSTAALSLGARLAAAREAAGLSLPEAAERLHLDTATLQGLEREQYQTLGAAVYVRGHLRRYAELLGLPVAEIETAYGLTATAVSGMPDLRRLATPLEAAASPSWALRPGPAAAVAALLALAALVWWAMRMPHTARNGAPVHAAPAAGESTTPGVPEAPATERGAAAPGAEIAPALREPAGVPVSSTAAPPPGLEAQRTAAEVSLAVAAAPKRAVQATLAGPAAPGSVRLALAFREDSWVEIDDAGGARLLYELAHAGGERELRGSAPLRIVLGNPGGVDLAVDGRPVTFSEPPRADSPLRLSLDGSGRVLEVRAAVTAGDANGPAGVRP